MKCVCTVSLFSCSRFAQFLLPKCCIILFRAYCHGGYFTDRLNTPELAGSRVLICLVWFIFGACVWARVRASSKVGFGVFVFQDFLHYAISYWNVASISCLMISCSFVYRFKRVTFSLPSNPHAKLKEPCMMTGDGDFPIGWQPFRSIWLLTKGSHLLYHCLWKLFSMPQL